MTFPMPLLITFFFFLFPLSLFAAPPDDLFKFRLPEKLGSIVQAYRGSSNETVILIENPRGNPTGQAQIASLLKLLREAGPARDASVAVEGASGPVETSEPFTLFGIDSPELYSAHQKAFVQTLLLTTPKGTLLEELYRKAEDKIFSPELKNFLSHQQAYSEKRLSVFSYCRILAGKMRREGKTVEPASEIAKVLRAGEIEEKISYRKVDEERKSILKRLERTLSPRELDQLAQLGAKLRRGEIPALPYYSFLEERLTPKEKETSPNLLAYLQIVRMNSEISTQALKLEIALAEEELALDLSTESNAKILFELRRQVFLYKKIVHLQLTREEWEEWEASQEPLQAPQIAEKLSELAGVPLSEEEKGEMARLDLRLQNGFRFYEAAIKREKNWVPALLEQMRSRRTQTSIFIAGAFHLPAVAKRLADQKISYLLISPREKEKEAWGESFLLARATPPSVTKLREATSLEIFRALAQSLDDNTLMALVAELRRKSADPKLRQAAAGVSTAESARQFVFSLPETRAHFLTQGKAKETSIVVRQQKEKLAQLFSPYLDQDFASMSVTERLNMMNVVSHPVFQSQLEQLDEAGLLTRSSVKELLENSLKNPALRKGAIRLSPAARDALSQIGVDPNAFASSTHELKLLLEELQLEEDLPRLRSLLDSVK